MQVIEMSKKGLLGYVIGALALVGGIFLVFMMLSAQLREQAVRAITHYFY